MLGAGRWRTSRPVSFDTRFGAAARGARAQVTAQTTPWQSGACSHAYRRPLSRGDAESSISRIARLGRAGFETRVWPRMQEWVRSARWQRRWVGSDALSGRPTPFARDPGLRICSEPIATSARLRAGRGPSSTERDHEPDRDSKHRGDQPEADDEAPVDAGEAPWTGVLLEDGVVPNTHERGNRAENREDHADHAVGVRRLRGDRWHNPPSPTASAMAPNAVRYQASSVRSPARSVRSRVSLGGWAVCSRFASRTRSDAMSTRL